MFRLTSKLQELINLSQNFLNRKIEFSEKKSSSDAAIDFENISLTHFDY